MLLENQSNSKPKPEVQNLSSKIEADFEHKPEPTYFGIL